MKQALQYSQSQHLSSPPPPPPKDLKIKAFRWLNPQNSSTESAIFLRSNKPLIQQIKKIKSAFSPHKKACPGENHQNKPLFTLSNKLTPSQIQWGVGFKTRYLALLNKLTRNQIPDLRANGPKSHLLLGFFCLFFLANTGCASLKWKTLKKQTKLEETASSEQAKPKSAQKNQRATAGVGALARNVLNKFGMGSRERAEIGDAARKRADDIFDNTADDLYFEDINYHKQLYRDGYDLERRDSIPRWRSRDYMNPIFPFDDDSKTSFWQKIDDNFLKYIGFNFRRSNFEGIVFQRIDHIVYPGPGITLIKGEFEKRQQKIKTIAKRTFFPDDTYEMHKIRDIDIPIHFTKSNLTDANMRYTIAEFVSFEEALMIGTKMEDGVFSFSSFFRTDMTEAVANRATFIGTHFTDTIMPGAKFNEAIFHGAKFSGENLDLRWTEFMGADLRGYAYRSELELPTSFEDVDLETMKSINFQGAVYNDLTLFPEGFDPTKAGMVYDTADPKTVEMQQPYRQMYRSASGADETTYENILDSLFITIN